MSLIFKILVLYAHPESQHSIANKALLQATKGLEHVTVHDLYSIYPDLFIDVNREQQLLCEHDIIVFQHPLYTYSCPSLLKEWFDRVLTRQFVSGESGSQLKGKYWRSIVTTGEGEWVYQEVFNMKNVLTPFVLTADMCEMRWLSPWVIYAARRQSKEGLRTMSMHYRQWLTEPLIKDGTA